MSKKVLAFFSRSHIGDFILAVPAFALLKKTYPEIKITVAIPKHLKELVVNNPVIDDYIIFGTYFSSNLVSKICAILLAAFNIPKILFARYDTAFTPMNSKIAIIVSKICFIKNIIGPADDLPSQYYTHKVSIKPHTHQALRFQTVIKSYFQIYNNALPVLPNFKKYDRITKKFLKNNGGKNIVICLKNSILSGWDIDNFARVCIDIRNKFTANFYIVGGGWGSAVFGEKFKEFLLVSDKRIKEENVCNLCGQTTLLELANFLDNCDLVITVNTGITHLAAVTKISIIDIYMVSEKDAVFYLPMSFRSKCFAFKNENAAIDVDEVSKKAIEFLTFGGGR
jgi:ADP-heptose:LPS heptosyltransferase